MKFTAHLAVLAAAAVAGTLAAPLVNPVPVLQNAAGTIQKAAGSLTGATTQNSASYATLPRNSGLRTTGRGTQGPNVTPSSNQCSNNIAYTKRDVDAALEARTIDPSALIAEAEAILSKFGAEKGSVLQYLGFLRGIGMDKLPLLQKLEGLLDLHGLGGRSDLGGIQLPGDIEAILKEIGGIKGHVLKWVYWVRNVLGYKKRKLLHELEDVLNSIGLLKGGGGLVLRRAEGQDWLDSIENVYEIIPQTLDNILGPIDGII